MVNKGMVVELQNLPDTVLEDFVEWTSDWIEENKTE